LFPIRDHDAVIRTDAVDRFHVFEHKVGNGFDLADSVKVASVVQQGSDIDSTDRVFWTDMEESVSDSRLKRIDDN